MKHSHGRRALLLALSALLLTGTALAGGTTAASAASSSDKGAVTTSKTVTREFRDADGVDKTVDSRDITLKVDHTKNLRGRERLKVTWSGARPSAGRASNPFGENGLSQEYPVVIMQCRGIDDPSLPIAKQVKPETCFTSTRQQRSRSADSIFAVWRHDLYATDADRAQKSGLDPIPASCSDTPSDSTHITPFVAASGTVYPACTGDTMPPEAAVGASFPPAEIAAFTDTDGRGQASYEVRSSVENESLGCSDKTPCSLVTIPIMGLSCIDSNSLCRQDGRFAPGSSNFTNEGVDPAVSPSYWWSASNWRNRISVPLTFGLPPGACDVLDKRAPTAFYGSELMSQAALQWSPAYCLRKDRFKFQHNTLGDEPAFALVEKGEAPAAFVSGTREVTSTEPIGYAPTAVTGFAVSFVVDNPDNKGERAELKLTPRLLAKLLTQSYTGSSLGQQHPGLGGNPLSINQDPEFQALNPGLDSISREAAASVLSLSESSDVVKTLTAYLAADPEAKAFIAGRADPWGMVVNPSYKGVVLPVSEYPLLDEFVPTSEQECRKENPAPYYTQLAAPVTSLRKIAEAVLDAWPNTQTKCERSNPAEPYKVGRIDRQGIGTRFMLGIVSLGDAARFGLRTAALQTASSVSTTEKFTSDAGRTFVAPTVSTVTAAAKLAKAGKVTEAFSLDMGKLRKQPGAYPGTMVVYTTAKLQGLKQSDATKVAEFIRIATTQGQVQGSGNGKLPDGFVPIKKSGATAALFKRAQVVARLIEAQKGNESKPAADADSPAALVPGLSVPTDDPAASTSAAASSTQALQTTPTSGDSSRSAAVLLPLLIILALLAGIVGPGTRLVATIKARR